MMKSLRQALLCLLLSAVGWAQGTRTWEQTKYEDFEKGTARGVAISSEGKLTLAPVFDALYTSPSSYIWTVVSDSEGNAYAGAGAPARVYKLTPDGKATIIFAPQELQVQALAVDAGGAIYAATSPDGKVYKIARGGPAMGGPPFPPQAGGWEDYSASVFFDPKTKYIWALAVDHEGRLYIGTGARGEIFRVDRSGQGSLFFQSDEAQIRALEFDNAGNLVAGTDGGGLIYRISPQGEGFVLYSAPKKEITALAVDGQGNIYAAGAGEKRATGAPAPGAIAPTPVPSAPATVVGPQVGSPSANAPSAAFVSPIPAPIATTIGGSEVYRISADGLPQTIWSSREDLVYALAFDTEGNLLAGTGNRGKIYAIRGKQYTDLAQASAGQVMAFARAPHGGLYAATSNLGKIFLLGANQVAQGTYESDVFDAKIFSRWGRVEVRGSGSFELYARSGNVENPGRNWSPWKKIDLQKDLAIDAPAARFIQWKAVLQSRRAPFLDSVTVNYLRRNIAPEVDEVTVMVGWRVPSGTHTAPETSGTSTFEAPLPTIPDRHSIVVKWKAHDDNGDTLAYNVYYRGDGETHWKLLREGVDERFVNLESDLFPDGGYTIRVVASDAPSRSREDSLTGEGVSPRFEVDNTPPRIESLNAQVEGDRVHVTFRAVDSFSPIKRAEYSIDAGDWQLVDPVGQISDYKIENYDFQAPIPVSNSGGRGDKPAASNGTRSTQNSDEHTIVVRVYDRFENVGINKVVVKAPAR